MRTDLLSKNLVKFYRLHFKVIILLLFCLLLLLLHLSINNSADINRETNYIFIKYVSSDWETQWIDNILKWQDEVCERFVYYEYDNIDKYLSLLEQYKQTKDKSLLHEDIFSYYLYKDKDVYTKIYIEPLVGLTRHPYFCKDVKYLMSLDYLLIDSDIKHINSRYTNSSISNINRSKLLLIDAGASFYDDNQNYIVNLYLNNNFQVDGIYSFEADLKDPIDVFDRIPSNLRPFYHWYNIPISYSNNDIDTNNNLIFYIKHIHKKPNEQYISVKIDIDNDDLEQKILNEIYSDKDVLSRIDELFFEHHINVKEMARYWGYPASGLTLADTYELMLKFRRAGVRMHSWV